MGVFLHVDLCFFLALSSYSFPLSSLFPLVESHSCLASINEEGKYWERGRRGVRTSLSVTQPPKKENRTEAAHMEAGNLSGLLTFWRGWKGEGRKPLRKLANLARPSEKNWKMPLLLLGVLSFLNFAWKASSFSTLVDRHTCAHFVSGSDFQFRWKEVVDKQSGISEKLTFCIWKMKGSLCILSEELWKTIWFWQCGTTCICYLDWLYTVKSGH